MTPFPSDEEPGSTGHDLLVEISVIAGSPQLVEDIGSWVDPETAFSHLFVPLVYSAWLDAGHDAETGWSHLATVGAAGYLLVGDPGTGSVDVIHPASARTGRFAGSIVDAMEAAAPATATSAAGFDLGWVGWLGYESGAAALGVVRAASTGPDSAMLFSDRSIAFDHARRTVAVRAFAGEGAAEWVGDTVGRLRELAGRPATAPADPLPTGASARLRHSPADYLGLIARCKDRIADGDVYQLCLTNQITVDGDVEPLALYLRLRRLNPTARGGLIVAGPLALASTSPELFLGVSPEGVILTKPIKGTRPRGADAVEDARLKRELRESAKEQAENLMIVDLMRNDFLRVAAPGSVSVPELFAVEQYRNVFQLVSTVTGTLARGRTALDAVRSAFPAGSMTGAPKLRAMEILSELEAGPRGAYSGAFGYIGTGQAVQLSMTIRTVVVDTDARTATIGTGGGITALSDPAEELDEMLLKAAPLLAALGAKLSTDGLGVI